MSAGGHRLGKTTDLFGLNTLKNVCFFVLRAAQRSCYYAGPVCDLWTRVLTPDLCAGRQADVPDKDHSSAITSITSLSVFTRHEINGRFALIRALRKRKVGVA